MMVESERTFLTIVTVVAAILISWGVLIWHRWLTKERTEDEDQALLRKMALWDRRLSIMTIPFIVVMVGAVRIIEAL